VGGGITVAGSPLPPAALPSPSCMLNNESCPIPRGWVADWSMVNSTALMVGVPHVLYRPPPFRQPTVVAATGSKFKLTVTMVVEGVLNLHSIGRRILLTQWLQSIASMGSVFNLDLVWVVFAYGSYLQRTVTQSPERSG
jgi:hypothetical protein